MADVLDLLNFKNPVFTAYLFWTGVLVLKLMSMSLLTGRQRFRKKVSAVTILKNIEFKME